MSFLIRVLLLLVAAFAAPLAVQGFAGNAPLAMGVALAAVLALGWLLVRDGLRAPLERLERVAGRWRSGELSARTAEAGGSEPARLAAALDRMAEALEARERERKSYEEELRRSRDEAVQANAAKARFISVANHDLRQPLHSIGMALSLLELRRGKAGADDMTDFARLKRATQSLETLLDSLLDISDLESGLIRPKVSEFDLGTVLQSVCDAFEEIARRKAVSFSLGECRVHVRSDPHLLGRMLRNLVSNAVKFTNPEGRVQVRCIVDEDRDSPHVRIEIRDTGIGIAPERLEHLFEPFFLAPGSRRDRSHGHGLGLAIVERIAKLLGHAVRVDSQPGKGSVFSVELPRASAVSTQHEPVQARPERVLLVEDDPLAAETTAELLRAWGSKVVVATSGSEALERIRSGGDPFDFVVADYRLPDMSGKDVIATARSAWPGSRAALITGDAMNEELQALESAGTRLLQKPVRAAALRGVLAEPG